MKISELEPKGYGQFQQEDEEEPQQLYYSGDYEAPDQAIRLVFIMGRTDICGGSKIIFQQANRLATRGFKVTLLAYGTKPTWYPLEVNFISVPLNLALSKAIPDCDLIVATYYTQIRSCIETGIAPVVYFEQGDMHLYTYYKNSPEIQAYIRSELTSCAFVLTVSKSIQRELKKLFGISSEVIENAIDEGVFNQGSQESYRDEELKKEPYVLMMGEDGLDYKGIRDVVKAMEVIKGYYPELKLYWITPHVTDENLLDIVDQLFIGPDERKIAELFRGATVYVSGSYHESFSLPVVEAMACGCPVISRFNLGVINYGKHGDNILITTREGHEDIVGKLHELLGDSQLQEKMIVKGLKTIKRFLWKNTIDRYADYYKSITSYRLADQNLLDAWDYERDVDCYKQKEDLTKLEKFLRYTDADEVYGVYLLKSLWGIIGHWDVVATKKKEIDDGKQGKREYCLVYQHSSNPYEYQKSHFPHLNSFYELVLDGKEREAEKEVAELLQKEKAQSEYWLLYAYLEKAIANDQIDHIGDYLEIIGDQTNQDYFIYGVNQWFEDLKEGRIPVMKYLQKNEAQKEIYYFADRLFEYGLYEDAVIYYDQYINNKKDEPYKRVAACHQKAMCQYYDKNYEGAKESCLKAFLYAPPRADECYLLGLLFGEEGRVEESCYWYEAALLCQEPEEEKSYIDESNWYFNPLLALCVLYYYEVGDLEKAIHYNEKAGEYVSNDNELEIVEYNAKFFKEESIEGVEVTENHDTRKYDD